ncbi:MAG: hypothetical protein HQL13_05660 [Candidatus Omnitrophica bacterium]|nr:hypothetical protein [Candidatus Omnitrophota bacterium]
MEQQVNEVLVVAQAIHTNINQIVIDPELVTLLPKHTPGERSLLEQKILQKKCPVRLFVWGNVLVDGHLTYEICQKHNIEVDLVEIQFDSLVEVKIWIIETHLATRDDLAPEN